MQKTNNSKRYFMKKAAEKIMLTILSTMLLSSCGARVSKKHKVITATLNQTQTIRQKENLIQELMAAADSRPGQSNHCLLRFDESIELAISKTGYTRLFIEEERITDVFVYPQEALQVRIHDQGYLIVVPNTQSGDTSKDKVYLTITGEQGTTQDLRLHFTGKNPEPVKFVRSNSGKKKASH